MGSGNVILYASSRHLTPQTPRRVFRPSLPISGGQQHTTTIRVKDRSFQIVVIIFLSFKIRTTRPQSSPLQLLQPSYITTLFYTLRNACTLVLHNSISQRETLLLELVFMYLVGLKKLSEFMCFRALILSMQLFLWYSI